jgi:hypothetical protein
MKLSGWQRLWVGFAALWALLLVLVGGHLLPFPTGLTESEIAESRSRYADSLRGLVWRRRAWLAEAMLAALVVPLGGVYVLGWSFWWIRQGFRVSR